jgi:hypothetical protein
MNRDNRITATFVHVMHGMATNVDITTREGEQPGQIVRDRATRTVAQWEPAMVLRASGRA